MTESSDAQLLQHAEALLADPSADADALLAVCSLCHGRLQALGDSHPLQAIPMALAALQLMDAFRRQPAMPPPWLHTREEQCCRRAALMIHGLLRAGAAEAHYWLPQGLQLLERLHGLHRHQLAWIPNMIVELQAALDQPARNCSVVMVGHAQAYPLLLELQRLHPPLVALACPNIHVITAADVLDLHTTLATTDVLITHRLPAEFRSGIGLDTPSLEAHLPSHATTLLISDLHFDGLHPWIGYAHDPDGRLPSLLDQSPLGDYHDFLAMAAADTDLDADALLARPLNPGLRDTLTLHCEASLIALAQQDQHCSVGIAEQFAAHYRQTPLLHTINLPTQAALRLLARALLHTLGLAAAAEPTTNHHELLGNLSMPIHPWVQQALDLDPWCQSWGQRQGEPFTIHDQLQQSIAFYRQHPWLIHANQHHPKLQLGRFLLLQSQPAAAVPAAPPTTAALINYFHDVDMLTQQLQAGMFDHYDRIYIWDGPYGYRRPLLSLDEQLVPLVETDTGRQLLADPRVRYHYAEWANERDKRISAYSAIDQDLVVIHDTDEFFCLDQERLESFWRSPYAVACLTLQNIFVAGLRASDAVYDADSLALMPRRWGVFKRATITPEAHLDHGWLVGVDQNPIAPDTLFPHPLGHIVHLTGCRNAAGQATKMAFYISQALKQEASVPVLEHLQRHIDQGQISRDQAQQILLRGDSGYSGVPHPNSGFRLNRRVIDPKLDDHLIERIIAAGHVVRPQPLEVLEGYPLQLWLDADTSDRQLVLHLAESQSLQLQLWAWPEGCLPQLECQLQLCTAQLELTLEARPQVLGRLLRLTLAPIANEPPRICNIDLGWAPRPEDDI